MLCLVWMRMNWGRNEMIARSNNMLSNLVQISKNVSKTTHTRYHIGNSGRVIVFRARKLRMIKLAPGRPSDGQQKYGSADFCLKLQILGRIKK